MASIRKPGGTPVWIPPGSPPGVVCPGNWPGNCPGVTPWKNAWKLSAVTSQIRRRCPARLLGRRGHPTPDKRQRPINRGRMSSLRDPVSAFLLVCYGSATVLLRVLLRVKPHKTPTAIGLLQCYGYSPPEGSPPPFFPRSPYKNGKDAFHRVPLISLLTPCSLLPSLFPQAHSNTPWACPTRSSHSALHQTERNPAFQRYSKVSKDKFKPA